MDQRVSLRDIARRAGVHFTTVGLALRNDPRVTAVTAARIRAVAAELGYTPDAMLSALSSYRHRQSPRFAGTLACLTTYTPEQLRDNITEQQLIAGATAQARGQGFTLESFQLNAPGMTGERLSKLLRARGIQGVMFSPRLPLPGPVPDLAWEHFSAAAVGYSITNLRLHRACIHHAHNIRLALKTLRARGYRRIGLVLPYEVFERSLGIVPGAYLAEQYLFPPEDRVEPLITEQVTKATLGHWLHTQRIDCVILSAYPLEMLAWIRELGYDVPGDLGVCMAQRMSRTEDIAGIDNQMDLLGDAAASLVISLLQHNERGLPVYPRTITVEGRWVDRPTVRPAPAA
jgi:LacI family transcriptional regulator